MEYSFIEAVDLFIKIHKVFQLKYDPKIRNIMYFFEYFVYGIQEAKKLIPKKYQDIGLSIFGISESEWTHFLWPAIVIALDLWLYL